MHFNFQYVHRELIMRRIDKKMFTWKPFIWKFRVRVSTHCNNENVHAKREVLTDHMYNVDGQINHVRYISKKTTIMLTYAPFLCRYVTKYGVKK